MSRGCTHPPRQPAVPPRRAQRGGSILDALLGFAVVVAGMVGSARLQVDLRLGADQARQRAEAARLAQQQIEQLRSFIALVGGSASYAAQGSARSETADSIDRNTRYTIERDLGEGEAAPLRSATVRVAWADRRGAAQALRLDSLLARSAPALGAALATAPAGRPVAPLHGRHIGIPAEAADLGDGRSAFKPALGGSVAWVLDNRSGRVTARCSGVAAARLNRDLRAADLEACDAVDGMLLSGRIRFAGVGSPPGTTVSLPAVGSAPADCVSESVKVVAYRVGDEARREALPAAATAADHAASAWTELGDAHLRYHCLVVPGTGDSGRRWSGHSLLVPDGWRIGLASGERRVCRFATAAAGLASDANAHHPEHYADVEQALVEQNFLVVDAADACPVAGSAMNLATVQHQP